MYYNEDDRAQRLLDVFDILSGQINVSYINSTEHIVAWHKHNIQTDYWTILKGSVKVGMATPYNCGCGCASDPHHSHTVTFEYLSDKNPRVLKIEPGVYHGYRALEPNTILVYYLTEKYNPDDEFRQCPGYFGEDWATENK
jgi:dTDP-4-dehydrorhamnose 3,5-epimerase-like enzyme